MKLSIVIPAYNEAVRLPPMLKAYAAYFAEAYGDDFELIVVPNNCSDETAEVARQVKARFAQIRILDDPGRVGKGGAVMLGAREACGGLIGFVDADGATPPQAFDDLVRHIGGAGCIIASRWLKGADVQPKQPIQRRVASRIFNTLVNVLFGLGISDTQCGAKLFRRDVMAFVLENLGVTNWAFDVDMLFQVRRFGESIREVATVWHDQAGSKIRIVRSSSHMLVAIVRLRLFYSPFRGIIRPASRLVTKVVPYKK